MNHITEIETDLAARQPPVAPAAPHSPRVLQRLYALYCAAVFLVLGISTLLINLCVPGLATRRRIAAATARWFFRAVRIPLVVSGLERLPRAPCIVIANHASYIDGIVAVAALPPGFAFVIKKEMARVPLAGMLLRGLGSEFVERFNRHEGAADARRVLRVAAAGQSLVFFPEGTFNEQREIKPFLGGAFTIAERSAMPVVAVAVHGTREVMPAGGMMVYRRPIRVAILAVLEPKDARHRSRQLIADAVGEVLAP